MADRFERFDRPVEGLGVVAKQPRYSIDIHIPHNRHTQWVPIFCDTDGLSQSIVLKHYHPSMPPIRAGSIIESLRFRVAVPKAVR